MCCIWSLHCRTFNIPKILRVILSLTYYSKMACSSADVYRRLSYLSKWCWIWVCIIRQSFEGAVSQAFRSSWEYGVPVSWLHFHMPMGLRNELTHAQALIRVNVQTEHSKAAWSPSIHVICQKRKQMFEQWLKRYLIRSWGNSDWWIWEGNCPDI